MRECKSDRKLSSKLERYKSKVVPTAKTIEDVYLWLEKNFTFIELSEKEIIEKYELQYELFEYNCRSISNSNNLSIRALEFRKDGNSQMYFEEYDCHILWIEEHFLIFECSSNRLFRELILEKGVSQFDYDHNTDNLVEYITHYFNLHSR